MPDTPDDGSGPNVGGAASGYTSRPVPDPTVLTTQALYREVAALRELIEQRIRALAEETNAERVATRATITEAIRARTILDEEVQRRTDLQFRLVEQQRVEQKKDTKDAVDAALTAQKEAVREQTAASALAIGKSEAATSKALEQLGVTFKTEIESLRRSIDENKDGLNALVNQKLGATTDRSGLYAALAALAVIITLGIAIASFIAAKGG